MYGVYRSDRFVEEVLDGVVIQQVRLLRVFGGHVCLILLLHFGVISRVCMGKNSEASIT